MHMILQIHPDPVLNDVVLLVGAFLFVVGIIGLSMVLKKKEIITGHMARKIVHLFAGFSIFIVPFLYIPHLALIISGLFLAVTRVSKPSTQVFEMMGEKNEREVGYLAGPFSYALSINILVLVFGFVPQHFFFPAASIMVMMISDTAASFFGKKYGKHKINIPYTKTVRSVEGSTAMLVTGFLLSLLAFSFFGHWFPRKAHTMTVEWVLLLSLLVAAVSTLIEVISPSNIDDLVVPIAGCFVSYLLTLFLFPTALPALL